MIISWMGMNLEVHGQGIYQYTESTAQWSGVDVVTRLDSLKIGDAISRYASLMSQKEIWLFRF